MDAIHLRRIPLHNILRKRPAGGASAAAAVKSRQLLVDLLNPLHLPGRFHQVIVQLHRGVRHNPLVIIQRILRHHTAVHVQVRVRIPGAQPIDSGPRHIVVLKVQRSADASAGARRALKELQALQPVVLNFLQHADTVLNAVHSHRVLLHNGIAFAAAPGPAHAQVRRLLQRQVHRRVPDLARQQPVNLQHGDRAVHSALVMANRVPDSCHLGRAGRDKKASHFLGLHAVLPHELPPCDHRGNLHRLAHVHNMVQQVRETHLDQPHNRRAGGRNHRPRDIGILQPVPDGAAHHVGAPGHLEHVVKAHLLQPVQHLGDAL